MAWPSSVNQTHVFVDDPPDWAKDVVSIQVWRTDILTAFSGAEQRARRRNEPRYDIMFETEELDQSFTVIRSRMLKEMGAPVVVPIWTRPQTFVSLVADVLTLDVDLTKSPFRIGSYVYFVESGKTSVFREIEDKSGATVDLVTGNAAYPNITPPTYTTAAKVYPCIVGIRSDNVADFQAVRTEVTRLRYHVQEL
jgi:hypothetical protein